MDDVIVLACDSLTDDDLRTLLRDLTGMDLVDDVLACTPDQARAVRRAIGW